MAAISGWERITETFVVQPGFSVGDAAIAPSGKLIVGGGFEIDSTDPHNVAILRSGPSQNGDAWEVIAHVASGGSVATIKAYGVVVDA